MEKSSVKIDAELPTAVGSIQVRRQVWRAPFNNTGVSEGNHLELSLMPRSEQAKACFPAFWGPHRYEPIGELFFVPAGLVIHAKTECRHQNSITIDFTPQAMAQWLGADMEWSDRRLQGCLDIVSHDIRSLMFRIGEEVRAPGLGGQAMLELMAAQVAIELARHITGIEEEKAIGGLSPWRLRLIDERLANEISPPSVSALATVCNISVRHLTRAFRVSRGRSIGSYVLEHRITHAKKLIESGMNIKAVSQAMDFTASSNFTAAFRRATGETPRDYKQRVSRSILLLPAQVH